MIGRINQSRSQSLRKEKLALQESEELAMLAMLGFSLGGMVACKKEHGSSHFTFT